MQHRDLVRIQLGKDVYEFDLDADCVVLVGDALGTQNTLARYLRLAIDRDGIRHKMARYYYGYRSDSEFFARYMGEGHPYSDPDKFSIFKDGRPFRVRGKLETKQSTTVFVPYNRVDAYRGKGVSNPDWAYTINDFALRDHIVDLYNFVSARRRPIPTVRTGLSRLLESVFSGHMVVGISGYDVLEAYMATTRAQLIPLSAWSNQFLYSVPVVAGFEKACVEPSCQFLFVEEPELGMHPVSLYHLLALLFELVRLGKKLFITTISYHVVEFMWFLGLMQKYEADVEDILDLFGLPSTDTNCEFAQKMINAKIRVYALESGGMHDITDLGVDDFDDRFAASFGGLTSVSERLGDVIALVVCRNKMAQAKQ